MRNVARLFIFGLCFLTFGVFAAEAVEATASTSSAGWAITYTLLQVFGAVVSAVATLVVPVLLAQLAKKFHLNLSADALKIVSDAAEHAVLAIEAKAAQEGANLTSNQKLNMALAAVKTIASQSAVKQFTDETLVHIIEAKVHALINGKETENVSASGNTTGLTA